MFPSASLRFNTQFVSCCKIHGGRGGWVEGQISSLQLEFFCLIVLLDLRFWKERVASCPGMFLMVFFLFYTANCILAAQL